MHFVPSIDRWHDSFADGFFFRMILSICAMPSLHAILKTFENNTQKEEITYGLRELKLAEYPEFIVFFFLTNQI